MARAIWTGAINFGLVSIPVGLYSATEDHTVHFHQFQRGTADRIRYQRVNARTGKEVDYADIVKGRDIGGGDFVIVEPEELEAVAPGRSRSIDITSFVCLDEIDPVYFQKTYWIAPGGEQYTRPYALLVEAMARTNRAGIATLSCAARSTSPRSAPTTACWRWRPCCSPMRSVTRPTRSMPSRNAARLGARSWRWRRR